MRQHVRLPDGPPARARHRMRDNVAVVQAELRRMSRYPSGRKLVAYGETQGSCGVAQQTMPSTFLVADRHYDHGHAVVELHGELDLAAAVELERLLVSSSVDRAERVTVDVGDLTFADCAGLHALQRSQDRLRGAGIRFGLRAVGPCLLRLLQLTGTVSEFELESD